MDDDIDFSEWEIRIYAPNEEFDVLKNSILSVYPNLVLPEAIKDGAKVSIYSKDNRFIGTNKRG